MKIANAQQESHSIVVASRNGHGWADLTHAFRLWDTHEGRTAEPIESIHAVLTAGRFDEELFKAALDHASSAGTDRPFASPVFRAPLARTRPDHPACS
jgi:hypothetical protein